MEIQNKKWDIKKFNEMRQEVLNQWPTGKKVDFEEALRYHQNLPKNQIMTNKLKEAASKNNTLIQPRAGVALLEEHIELLRFLRQKGKADVLPTTIDSYTRQNRYEEAEKGIRESKKAGRSLLNGFPAVNYGVQKCRKVIESLDCPVQVRHGTPDARLLAEIALAGGFTDFEGGGISYNVPYAKKISIEQSIYYWQYVDRLVGIYEENGVSLNREPFGPLTGTLVPPCISHSIGIIEGILAAEQGVRNITLGYGQCGNLIQDVAAVETLKELSAEYLKDYNVMITTAFHQWMGGFPQDEAQAFGVISWGAATAALSKATKVIVKTPHEALGIPTKEANAEGLRATRQVIDMLKDQRMISNKELEKEKEIIKRETRQILSKVYELGEGDWAKGAVRAFAAGVLDVPFAPSQYNAGKILPARDNSGAVRFLNFGSIPFDDEIKEFHRRKLAERAKAENREVSFQMVIDDIYAIGQGMLVGRMDSKIA